jgi:hypothetical protein
MMDPSRAPSDVRGEQCHHAVTFYDTSESLCRVVAQFLGHGFLAAQPALVIATRDHRAGIMHALHVQGLDVRKLVAAGDLVMLDAAETLSTLMVGEVPDESRFRACVEPLIEHMCRGRTPCNIRAYGEMVDVLCGSGQSAAALQLEMLWNRFAVNPQLMLLCGYSMRNAQSIDRLGEIWREHTHVMMTNGAAAPIGRSALQ